MPSLEKDARHARLVGVLVPLLQRACPEGGGGLGGTCELRLIPKETAELGGLGRIRSAMRKAARSLRWSKLQTYGQARPIPVWSSSA